MQDPDILSDVSVPGVTRREFAIGAAALAAVPFVGCTAGDDPAANAQAGIVIVGGGAAGITMASLVRRRMPKANVTIVEPAERHFYQPGFTMIGAGVWKSDDIWVREESLIPKGVRWIREKAAAVEPDHKVVVTSGGQRLRYDFLILVPGIQENWSLVDGISKATLGQGNAHSIYDFEGSIRTRAAIERFVETGGRGVYADTWTKLKCGGAPKKICLLTEHLARKKGTRARLKLDYFTASKELYDVPFYTPRLEAIYKERNVPIRLNAKLTGVDVQARRAYFEDRKTGAKFTEEYDFLHFAPPQSAPDFVRESGLGWTEGKLAREAWVEVDSKTLVHRRFPDIISLGDVAGIPTSKTSASIKKQAPVAMENLVSLVLDRKPTAEYDGYAACPIITDYGHVLMCEFGYDKKPHPTFPLSLLDTSKELRSGWWLKKYMLKAYYFKMMLKGIC